MAIAAIRNNNPGNVSLPIRGYTGPGQIVGIQGQSGYGSFPTMADGLAAQRQQIGNYIDNRGLTTIAALNTRYAEDPNWKFGVARASGIGVNEPLDTSNAAQMQALQGGIIRQETGMDPSRFGLGAASPASTSAPMNSNDPASQTGTSGLDTSVGDASSLNGSSFAQAGGLDPSNIMQMPGLTGGDASSPFGSGVMGNLTGNPLGAIAGMVPGPAGQALGMALPFFSGGGFNPAAGIGAIAQRFGINPQGLTASPTGVTSAALGSMTVPQAIDSQTRGNAQDTSAINQQTQKNTDALNKTATANTKTATDKAQSLYDTATKSGSDYFVRVVFIVVGLIALAAGLMLFKPVQQAAAGVAAKVPKVPV